jgi:hypothetical protein
MLGGVHAGTPMMISPKAAVSALVIWFQDKEHSLDCECSLCKYRKLRNKNEFDVQQQRSNISRPISDIKRFYESCASPIEPLYSSEMDDKKVVVYLTWFYNNFPEASAKLQTKFGNDYLIDSLYHSTVPVAENKLLDWAEDWLSVEGIDRAEIDRMAQIDFGNEIDYWDRLELDARLRRELLSQDFERAISDPAK